MNFENIIVDKKEIGKLIGQAKRVWTTNKTIRVPLDTIQKEETQLFKEDTELARMVKAKKLLDEKIEFHIDHKLAETRGHAFKDKQERLFDIMGVISRLEDYLTSSVQDNHPIDEVVGTVEELKKELSFLQSEFEDLLK